MSIGAIDIPGIHEWKGTSEWCCPQCDWLTEEALNAEWEDVEQGDE